MSRLGELLDGLAGPSAADDLRALDDQRRLTRLLPELEAARGFLQPERHYYDVLDHSLAAVAAMDTMIGATADGDELRQSLGWIDLEESMGRVIDGIPMPVLLRLSCLVHDISKPETATTETGALRFPRHGPRGAEVLRSRLPEIGLAPGATDFVARMVRYHLRPGELVRNWPASDHAIRKFASDLNGHVLPLMLVNVADGMATRGPGYTRENFRRHTGLVNYVVARAWAVTQPGDPPLVTGEDLIRELDLESGRLLGRVLTSVRHAQERGTVGTREQALALAREILTSLRGTQA